MHRPHVAARNTRSILRIGTIWLSLFYACAAHADLKLQSLPNLPGSELPPPLQWQVDQQGAALAYQTRLERWEAKINQLDSADASLAVDYGFLLTNRLGAGTSFTRERDFTELVANAVYAHRHNLRFRLSGAQLRTTDTGLQAISGDAITFRQNSYLLSARKHWPHERFVSDLGLALYRVDATPSTRAQLAAAGAMASLDGDEDRPASVTSGRLNGFMLNLGLRPTWQSKIELRREFSHIDYHPYTGQHRRDFLSSGRVSYQQHLGNCLRLRAGYSLGSDAGRLDLNLSRENWNIRLAQDFNGDHQSTMLQLGFNIPVDGKVSKRSGCAMQRQAVPSFTPIVEATLQRPQQFPREPLAVIETQ